MKIGFGVRMAALALTAMTGCAGAPATRPTVVNHQAPGNLESTQALSCAVANDLKNTYTPPDLYRGMVSCINQGDYSSAVYFFALAGTYTYYDSLRVADTTAHQAHTVLLQNSLASLDDAHKDALRRALQSSLGNREKLPAVCRRIAHVGAPRYYPRYMLQHGMGAFLGTSGDGLVKPFDSEAAWKRAMRGYLRCP